jgi:hypothetical protein
MDNKIFEKVIKVKQNIISNYSNIPYGTQCWSKKLLHLILLFDNDSVNLEKSTKQCHRMSIAKISILSMSTLYSNNHSTTVLEAAN